jgi:hypothetical protein
MFNVAYGLIVEFSVLLVMFLSLSATPLERMRMGRILGLMTTAACLLLGTLFGILPHFSFAAQAPMALVLAGAVMVVIIAVVELAAAVTVLADSLGAARRVSEAAAPSLRAHA